MSDTPEAARSGPAAIAIHYLPCVEHRGPVAQASGGEGHSLTVSEPALLDTYGMMWLRAVESRTQVVLTTNSSLLHRAATPADLRPARVARIRSQCKPHRPAAHDVRTPDAGWDRSVPYDAQNRPGRIAASTGSRRGPAAGRLAAMTEPDPTLARNGATFTDLDAVKSHSGYTLVDPRGRTPLDGRKPFLQSDRFELFYWSDIRGRCRTFEDAGRLQTHARTRPRDLPGGTNFPHPDQAVRRFIFR